MATAKRRPPATEVPPPPPLILESTKQFDRDAEFQARQGKAMEKLRTVIAALIARQPLPVAHQNHRLSGKLEGAWGCHIQGDWVLVYEKTETVLRLLRTGTHSHVFRK